MLSRSPPVVGGVEHLGKKNPLQKGQIEVALGQTRDIRHRGAEQIGIPLLDRHPEHELRSIEPGPASSSPSIGGGTPAGVGPIPIATSSVTLSGDRDVNFSRSGDSEFDMICRATFYPS